MLPVYRMCRSTSFTGEILALRQGSGYREHSFGSIRPGGELGRSAKAFIVEVVMRSPLLFLLVMFALVGCQDKKADPNQKNTTPSNKADPGQKSAAELPPGVVEGPMSYPPPERAALSGAPSVCGKILVMGQWKDEWFTAGVAGKGRDGKQFSNLAGTEFSSLGSGQWATSGTFKPQLTTIFNDPTNGMRFMHVKMAPGDYVIYVQRGKVPSAWAKVTVKEGDELTADLTIDPAKTGSIVVTLPDEEANAKISLLNSGLFLIPIEFDKSNWFHDAFAAGYVEQGNKTVAKKEVPAGKYLVLRGKSQAEVEVTAGKESAITLVRKESKPK
jgi:hypothetical protein